MIDKKTREIAVQVPPVEDLGPKMQALNERQRAFVTACLEIGKLDNTRAAALAGYTGDARTLGVTGHRLAHTLAVQEAMHEEAGRRLHGAKIMAVSELVNIANSSMDEKVKLRAIGMILNRTGMHETSEHKVVTRDESKTEAAMIERIEKLAKDLGIDPRTLLGQRTPALPAPVDAEFTVVEDATAEGEGSAEGLEDLL